MMIEQPKLFSSMMVVLSVSLIIGCASKNRPGPKPAAVPPQLVLISHNRLAWDRPRAFGPVPAALQSRGNRVCFTADQGIALGYHPQAKNQEGLPFAGGGFLCSK